MEIGVVGIDGEHRRHFETCVHFKAFVDKRAGVHIHGAAVDHAGLNHILTLDIVEREAQVETVVEEILTELYFEIIEIFGFEVGVGGGVEVEFAQVGAAETFAV